ncbi:Heterogeneous nuclear ribonucleoprotein K [Trichuris trichiura]|uniref:Heterogeneous nuclear ribonucleoprotein K n=1 Tax=Trichuris trichiura TaxID=36087 RepID=A0A077Z459_TRITR|nr:Heterogeneous nuclear ribonucleoprotein K [Trichuris trichiura]
MKRFNDNRVGANDAVKRVRDLGNQLLVRLLIPSRAAGAVIGKGGSFIQYLRSEVSRLFLSILGSPAASSRKNAVINLPDSDNPERVVYISSNDMLNIVSCVAEIIPKLEEGRYSPESELRVLIHHSQAGAVIGRAGFKINEIRESTGANIKVFTDCAPMSSDRVVQFSGSRDAIVNALFEVTKLCQAVYLESCARMDLSIASFLKTPIRGVDQPYDPVNYDLDVVCSYGGFPPDKAWKNRRPIGGQMLGVRPVPTPFHGVAAAPPFASPIGVYAQPPPTIFAEGPLQTVRVTIPNDLAGSIIGRRGERINRIRQESRANIVVDPPVAGAVDRVITISGLPSQIRLGHFLLQQW